MKKLSKKRSADLSSCVYDIIGIGLGPFNLGLAALCYSLPELNCLFIEQKECFNWHPGLLIEDVRLQVPFYADLVTLANPGSPFSYLAYLKAIGNMFRFAIHENYFITRKEYNRYCQWVCSKLDSLKFNTCCNTIRKAGDIYHIETNGHTYYAKHIVIGTGTIPSIPDCVSRVNHPLVFHSADYLFKKEQAMKQESVTLIGSGQSAAEIFHDLLQQYHGKLYWYTRADRIFPMDYSKFALEMASPDYIDYFFGLSQAQKLKTLKSQDDLYKGINHSLINAIYDQLYKKSLDADPLSSAIIYPNRELINAVLNNQGSVDLTFTHRETFKITGHPAKALILATGYKPSIPGFIAPLRNHIQWQDDRAYSLNRNYSVDNGNSIFVQNADTHTHGFNSADLGLGPYRNSVILNSVLGRPHFVMEQGTSFQAFG